MAKSSSHKGNIGSRRKIILAFDIGTTYSGISYSILDADQIPGIFGVTRFPAQETISGASKIPTVMYYDSHGTMKAAGAEATREGIYDEALASDWCKAEWFKLQLRQRYGMDEKPHPDIPALPPNKSVVDVFADFFRYLLCCAGSYIQETHTNGKNLWNSLKGDIHYVLSHPNGWEGTEQDLLRKAAVKAGLIPDTLDGHTRVSFVTEGEASLHFAIQGGALTHTTGDDGIIVIDAGGGTIDISTYKCVSQGGKRVFEEIAVPQSYGHGSIFVTLQAKDFLKEVLANSPYLDDLDHICNCFDSTTKQRFRNAEDPQYIRFGSVRDNDITRGIRFGQIKIAGSDVAKFFQPSINCIVYATTEQERLARCRISHVILVGGFAANDWVFENVKSYLARMGIRVMRPANHVNKAVSDGAISFYLDHYVRTRVAKVTYGSMVALPYNSSDPEHTKRAANITTTVTGIQLLPGAFRTILAKNTQVSETKEFSIEMAWCFSDPKSAARLEKSIMCYRGNDSSPEWIDRDPDNFTPLCTLVGDLSRVPKASYQNENGGHYYTINYEIVLIFGLTDQLRWKDKRGEQRSPAKLIYHEA